MRNLTLTLQVFNIDETGISTVHIVGKILDEKDLRRCGAMTSEERGETVTVVRAMSGSEMYIPALFIYARNQDIFLPMVLQDLFTRAQSRLHYLGIFFRMATPFSKLLLVMDNHVIYTSYAAYKFCKDNGIVVVSLSPYTSHRLQPL